MLSDQYMYLLRESLGVFYLCEHGVHLETLVQFAPVGTEYIRGECLHEHEVT